MVPRDFYSALSPLPGANEIFERRLVDRLPPSSEDHPASAPQHRSPSSIARFVGTFALPAYTSSSHNPDSLWVKPQTASVLAPAASVLFTTYTTLRGATPCAFFSRRVETSTTPFASALAAHDDAHRKADEVDVLELHARALVAVVVEDLDARRLRASA